MINGKHVLALVPARRGSKGLPGKNMRLLGGKPLLAWPIAAARAATAVDRVVLSTDDPDYAATGREHGADVPFLRPADLASDTAPSIDFILHAVDTLAAAGDHYHYLVLLEPTSPLTDAEDIDAALARLDAAEAEADALIGVTALVTTHPAYAVTMTQGGLIRSNNGQDFRDLPRRQDLEPLFCLDGSIYISTVEALRRERGFCHARTLAYETARHKAFEVDDLVDFICIDAISRNLDMIKRGETLTELEKG